MGEYQNPEILEAVTAGKESGVSQAEESVTREPYISEVALGYVSGGLLGWQGRMLLFIIIHDGIDKVSILITSTMGVIISKKLSTTDQSSRHLINICAGYRL